MVVVQKGEKMYLIDTRKYDDSFLLAKILEKVDITGEEKKKLFKHFEKPEVVDAESVRHGLWVNHISENGATDGTYCSQCDYEVDRDAKYNYCPNCGAKMGEEEEDEI